MRVLPLALIPLLVTATGARAATLGEARVGFSAERILVIDGHSYTGRMWQMPGVQRHEQELPGFRPVFILHADSAVGDVVLPQLHTIVEFAMPRPLSILASPALLQKPVGQEVVNGIATTRYAVDATAPEGHAAGSLWLSRDGIPIKCEGRFETPKGKVSTIRWELRHLQLGPQNAALFEMPNGFTKLPPEAIAPLLGMKLAPAKAQ
jgi:hypothetical protein